MASHFDRNTTGTAVAEHFSSNIRGKIILITGVNKAGLGGKLVEILSAHGPKTLILASRTPSKIEDIIESCKVVSPNTIFIPVQIDLSSQKSCREAAGAVVANKQIQQIDLVFNSAAVMRLPERQLSPEGLEMQFATNHAGHFLFTNLIMSKILAAARSNPRGTTRIVNVSSRGVVYSPIRFSDLSFEKTNASLPAHEQPDYESLAQINEPADPEKRYTPQVAYGQSKTANVLFSLGLTARLYEKYGVLSFGVHPGTIVTELARSVDQAVTAALIERFKGNFVTADQGCATSLRAALDESLGPADFKGDGQGVFLAEAQLVDWCPAYARDPKLAEKLWTVSEGLVGEAFDFGPDVVHGRT